MADEMPPDDDNMAYDLLPGCYICGYGTMLTCHACGRYVCQFGGRHLRHYEMTVQPPLGGPHPVLIRYCVNCYAQIG